jgi:hypothetical protein
VNVVVRNLTPEELALSVGTYHPRAGEWMAYAVASVILGPIFFAMRVFLGSALAFPYWARVLLAACSSAVALATILVQALSVLSIAHDQISYVSIVPWLSWSVPLHEITACELISRRAKELRIRTVSGSSRSLILTYEAWSRLQRRTFAVS